MDPGSPLRCVRDDSVVYVEAQLPCLEREPLQSLAERGDALGRDIGDGDA
jgi:hypothetical protein